MVFAIICSDKLTEVRRSRQLFPPHYLSLHLAQHLSSSAGPCNHLASSRFFLQFFSSFFLRRHTFAPPLKSFKFLAPSYLNHLQNAQLVLTRRNERSFARILRKNTSDGDRMGEDARRHLGVGKHFLKS